MDLLAVIAEPNRRRLLEYLSSGEQSVGALSTRFNVSRSAISQHLSVLIDANLLEVRQVGRSRLYRLNPAGIAALKAQIDAFWNTELDELAISARTRRNEGYMEVDKSIVVPLNAAATFAMITEPERIRRWKAITARLDLRVGGEYRFTVTPGHVAEGTILEIEPGRRLVYTWGWTGTEDLPPGASTVTITLEPQGEHATLVRLVHEGLTAEQAEQHGAGWDHFLGRLQKAAGGGDAGTDEWAAIPDPLDQLGVAEAALGLCQSAVRGLTGADLDSPTPCQDFSIGQLGEHLLGSLANLTRMGGGEVLVPSLEDTLESRIADAGAAALETWRARGLEGSISLGSAELPARSAADILIVELLVHAWDFASARGQVLPVSEQVSAYALERTRGLIDANLRAGRFADPIEVPSTASSLDRLVAFTGRSA